MTPYHLTINNKDRRDLALKMVQAAPDGTRLEFKGPRRSLPQNARMWAMLTDIATQLKWCDQVLRPEDWKLIFLDALKRDSRTVPNLDGNGFVYLGRSSSDLSKEDMSNLLELMMAFGVEHGVKFHDREAA